MPNLDLWPLLEKLEIKPKNARIKKLRRDDPFAWAQREFVAEVERQYNAGEPVRIIVLKGRQVGLSTVTEAILFIWAFLHPGSNALVLSKKQPDADYLFSMFKRYWEKGPFYGIFNTTFDRIGYLEWAGTGSSVTTETAKSEDVGRGKTIQAVHGSEVAFWPNQDALVGSLNEAVPDEHGTIIIYESTANGVGGFFHDEWVKAIDPAGDKSAFTPMFFPWWEHEEYEIAKTNLKYADLDDDERDLLGAYAKMTIPKLAWRRRKMLSYSNPETFKQEYPNSMEEAFLSTGYNVFPLVKLAQCYDNEVEYEQGFLYNDDGKLAFADDEGGHLFVYHRPAARRRYVVGCDPTYTIDGDPACICVLDRDSMEQVAVWHGSADPDSVGDIALALAYWYGSGTILNTEVQGGGKTVLNHWRDANYPNIWMDRRPDRPKKFMQAYGWNSTYETKKWMLGTMMGLIQRRHIKIHHPATYYEMTRYVSNEDGTYGPSRRSGHDDTVIALGVALMTIVTEKPDSGPPPSSLSPGPPYVPGQMAPRLSSAYGSTWQGPGSNVGPMEDDDALVGVDSYY
jgi:hypothetical protein